MKVKLVVETNGTVNITLIPEYDFEKDAIEEMDESSIRTSLNYGTYTGMEAQSITLYLEKKESNNGE